MKVFAIIAMLAFTMPLAAKKPNAKTKSSREKPPTPLDRYVAEAESRRNLSTESPSPGSLFNPNARFADLALDLRARRVDDVLTIVVDEKANATAKGTTQSKRATSANSSISAIAGPTRATGALANLAALGGQSSLDGTGETTRSTVLQTTLTARVVRVLPNGNLLIEGSKTVGVNSESQTVIIRGVVRPIDVDTSNMIQSDRIAQMEVMVNGKGVVNDSIRRPFFLYRILLGLLPF